MSDKLLMNKVLSKYTKLEYIENIEGAYINTGYCPNSNTEVEFEFSTTSAQGQCVFGEQENVNNRYSFLYMNPNSNNMSNYYSNNYYKTHDFNANVKYKIEFKNYTYNFNSNKVFTYNETNFNSTIPAYLFAINNRPNNPVVGLRIYYFKIWDNGILVRDFVPVKRTSDSEIGLLDLIENKFYTNAGTGEFIYSE